MKIACANFAFFHAFRESIPSIEVVKDLEDIKKYNLVIFTGGEDINPELYGEKNKYSYCNSERDDWESKVFSHCRYFGTKMLGVCRGHQLLNVLNGGFLFQDLQMDFGKSHPSQHELESTKETGKIPKIFSGKVNSMHHQGVKIGRIPVTSTYNGIPESCESSDIITVQFHPEFMNNSHSDLFFEYIQEWANEKAPKKSSRRGGEIYIWNAEQKIKIPNIYTEVDVDREENNIPAPRSTEQYFNAESLRQRLSDVQTSWTATRTTTR